MLTKLYGGHGPEYLNDKHVLVLAARFFDAFVERLLLRAIDEEGGVEDHAVADRLVRSARDGDRLERLVDVGDVARAHLLERRVDQPAELHAREVGRRRRVPADLVLEAADLVVLALEVRDDLLAIPQHLEAELDLVLHLVQHVAERLIGRAQELGDVVLRAEHGAERHRDDGELLHHRLVHELVRQDVVARGIVDDDGRVADDGREVLERDREHALPAADPDRSEVSLAVASHDAVDVLAAVHARTGASFPAFRHSGLVRSLPEASTSVTYVRMKIACRARLARSRIAGLAPLERFPTTES